MTPHEIQIVFARVIADAGLGDTLIPADGKLHRFKVPADKGRQRTGWGVLYGDGLPAGVAGDWRTGERITWKPDGVRVSEADRRELAALRRMRDAEREGVHRRAAAKAKALYARLPAAPEDHPYLERKQVAPGPCKTTSSGALALPVYDAERREIMSLQFIRPSGEKRFLAGGRTAGGCCILGADTSPLVIVEGYSTGWSIHAATDWSVVVAFNAGNLRSVAKALHKKHPDYEIIVAADNDENTEGNPGVTKATEAAAAVGARLVVPNGPGDFNDLFVEQGAEVVKAMFVSTDGQPDTPKRPDNVVNLFPTPDEAVARLAELEEWEYELKRKAEAKRLGVRASALDDKIKAMRARHLRAGEDEAPLACEWQGPANRSAR